MNYVIDCETCWSVSGNPLFITRMWVFTILIVIDSIWLGNGLEWKIEILSMCQGATLIGVILSLNVLEDLFNTNVRGQILIVRSQHVKQLFIQCGVIILLGIRIVVGVIVILIFGCIRIKVSRSCTVCSWVLGTLGLLWVLRMYTNIIIIIIEIEFIGMSTLWYENVI